MLKPLYKVLLFAVLLGGSQSYAQPGKSDSLRKLLAISKDTFRVNILNQLSASYWYSDPSKTFEYARQAMELAKQLHFQKGLATAYNHTGGGYYQTNRYDSALAWYQKAVEEHRSMKNYRGEANVLTNIGLIYWKKGEFPEAVKYNLEALRIWEANFSEQDATSVYSNLGNVYSEQGAFDQALINYNKSLALLKKYNKSGQEISMNLSNIGTAYLGMNKPAEALKYFLESLDYLEEGEKESRAVSLSNTGLTYLDMKKYEDAAHYLSDAVKLQEEIGDNDGLVHTLMGLSQISLHKGKLPESRKYAARAVELAQKIDDKSAVSEAWLTLSDIVAKQGDYRNAYQYYINHVSAKDSLLNKENIFKIASLQAGIETEKKQIELELLKKETQQQSFRRNAVLIGLFALLIIAGLVVSRQRLKIKQNNQLLHINEQLKYQSRQLETQTLKLRETDRVKSTFFANISHEFRTPLTLILNSLSDKIGLVKNSSQKEDLPQFEMMHRNAKRLLDLINQLLDLSKLEAGAMKLALENCDLTQMLQVTHASFLSLSESRKVNFLLSAPSHPVICRLDADKMEKILYNLLSNAFKFTPVGGEIMLSAELSVGASGKNIRISVQDSGQGISPEQLPLVFNRFYQGKQYYSDEQGTGIGLALTKELVELHRGSISVQNNNDKGASFTVMIPFAPSEGEVVFSQQKLLTREYAVNQAGQLLQAKEISMEDSGRPTVLVVEDNEDLRNYIKTSLGAKYKVIESENGVKGLEKAIATLPDLIISDWMMPEMDGITLCTSLKNDPRTSHIPIILLTALTTGDARIQGLETGADDYLTKPFDNRELDTRITNLVENRRQLRERFSREMHVGPRKVSVNSMDEQFLEKVMEAIETNMGDPDFTMEKFGQEVSLSRMQLHRKLKALTDQSPGDLLRSMRMKRAKHLLEARSGNVSEIAYGVGFNNLSYFSKCYREAFGLSPNETLTSV